MRAVLIAMVMARVAAADTPSLDDTMAVTVTATSTLTKPRTYDAWGVLATDVTYSRFWCEGKRDEGIGEALVFDLATPTKLDSITISGGVWKGDLFKANNIVTGLDVITDDGRTKSVTLPEERKEVDVVIGGAPVKKLTLKITRVKLGRMNDSCISEVVLHTTPKRSIVLGVDAAGHAALVPTFTKLWHAVKDCDEAVLRAQLHYPFSYSDVGDKGMRTTKLADVKAVLKACKSQKFDGMFPSGDAVFAVRSNAPRDLMINQDVFGWMLVFEAGQWKLAGLVDSTP